MKLLIFGPPGSGKGTQSLRLSRMLGVRHVSTGDLLRNAIRDETPLGFDVSECVAEGRLVPDVLISELVHARLGQLAARDSGFLLDGFPRTRRSNGKAVSGNRPGDGMVREKDPRSTSRTRLTAPGRSSSATSTSPIPKTSPACARAYGHSSCRTTSSFRGLGSPCPR